MEARGNPVPVPLKPGGALFMSNLCIHTSKVNTTQDCRWSIDFRHFPTPDRAVLTPEQREEADFVRSKSLKGGRVPLVVLTKGHKPTWEEWEAEVLKLATTILTPRDLTDPETLFVQANYGLHVA